MIKDNFKLNNFCTNTQNLFNVKRTTNKENKNKKNQRRQNYQPKQNAYVRLFQVYFDL